MNSISNTTSLSNAIKELEKNQQEELIILKNYFQTSLDELKPTNLIKNAIGHLSDSTSYNKENFRVIIGWGVGYLVKKIMDKPNQGLLKKVLHSLLQIGITKIIAQGFDSFKLDISQIANSLKTSK